MAWRASNSRAWRRAKCASSSIRAGSPRTPSTSASSSQLLEKSNFSVAAGQITGNGERLSVRPLGEFRSLDEIRNLVIKGNVHVGDVASVELVSPEITRRRHLDGRPAVGLDVFKSTQANVVEVVDRVLEVIEHNKALPQMQGIRVFIIDNQAEAIRTSLSDLTEAGLIGAALAFAVLFLFLRHWPTTLIVSAVGAAVAAGDARGDVLRRAHHQRDVDDGHDAGHRHAGGQRRGGHRERVPPPADGSRTIRRRRRSRASRKSASPRSPAPPPASWCSCPSCSARATSYPSGSRTRRFRSASPWSPR